MNDLTLQLNILAQAQANFIACTGRYYYGPNLKVFRENLNVVLYEKLKNVTNIGEYLAFDVYKDFDEIGEKPFVFEGDEEFLSSGTKSFFYNNFKLTNNVEHKE